MRATQFTLFSLLSASCEMGYPLEFNLPQGVTTVSRDIYGLHMTVLWVCVIIGIIVFGSIIYSIIYHRKSKGAKAAHFHEHLWLEITWTLVPFFILVGLAIPGTRVLINMNDEAKPDLTIKITGYQWKWKYEYLDKGVSFFSNLSTPFDEMSGIKPKNPNYLREVDHPLVVPIHKKIRFLVTSNDVIHAWWVPELGVKRDAVPGFINETWARVNRPGTYRGQCAELCGINHALMPIVVSALSEQGFENWLNEQKTATQLTTVASATPAAATAPTTQAPPLTQAQPTPLTSGEVAVEAAEAAAEGAKATAEAAEAISKTSPVTKAAEAAASGAAATAKAVKDAVEKFEGTTITQPTLTTTTKPPIQKTQPGTPKSPTTPTTPTAPSTPTTPSTSTPTAAAPTATPKKSLADLMKQGEQVFLGTCAVCHQSTGEGLPPTYPALKGSKIVTGPLPTHLDRVLNGKPGTAMQAFRDQFSVDDLAAVITYERNAWGNNTGDAVQPDQVKAALALPPGGS